MDEQTLQTVTLDNEETLALHTEDGRVFYDIDSLVATFTMNIMVKTQHGTEHGCLDDNGRWYLLGQVDMLDEIADQIDALRMEYAFNMADAERP